MDSLASVNELIKEKAEKRQEILTKPMGSLGILERIAVQFAAWQGDEQPQLDRIHISVFAADHGVAVEGVSAFPQVVTGEMVKNFVRGGAAISVLAHYHQATLEIIDVGVKDFPKMKGVIQARAGNATHNIAKENAMTTAQLHLALQAGKDAADRAKTDNAALFVGGEMGISNTTSATAIACELLGDVEATELTGAGTGLDRRGVEHKAMIVSAILERYKKTQCNEQENNASLSLLRRMGGFEITALVAAFIRSAQLGIPVLVDGFITTVAALVAIRINNNMKSWMLFSHCSAESGHATILSRLDVTALVDFNMRLGEASGAAVVIPLIKQALALHNNMATFAEADVSK